MRSHKDSRRADWAGAALPALALAAASAFWTVAVVQGRLQALDEAVRSAVGAVRTSGGIRVMLAFSYLGSEYLTPLLLLAALIVLARRARPWAVYLAASVFAANAWHIVLKQTLAVPRPDPPLFPYWQAAGYPSGHTFIGLAFAWGVLVYLNARQPWWWAGPTRRLLTALMALWPMVVGGSRVYLDAHWASDI
ncbi:MAG: phosphatase PAP2 family protein, partial [Bacillota bacterium]|nr:phosphatase PAP2 family protein [Bacillota bacterium]